MYCGRVEPQPPRGSPLWEGHIDGGVYYCQPADGVFTVVATFWAATPPAGAMPPDPAELAQQAVASMGLKAIDIGIVPEPGANRLGLVGMPTWMWVAQPSQSTWGPITRSASAGGITVTATAKVARVEWNMGDGNRVTCTRPGTAYQDHYGKQSSPDCGHRYTRTSLGKPGDAYQISAISYWTIPWSGGGESGTISLDFTSDTQIRVGEMQVVVTN